jgi:HEAT repeat protein
MRSIQFIWTYLVRRPGAAVLTVTLFCAGLGLADRFPPDPVEELRLALKAPPPHANLAKRIEALRSLADMRRALGLQEWRSEVGGTDEQIYAVLADRFKKQAQQLLKNGSPDVRLAVMDMLAEMGPSLRSPQDPRGIAGALAPELAELVKNGDTPQLRTHAARALGLVFPDASVALPPLLDMLTSPNISQRRTAANALVDLLRVTNQLSSRASGIEAERVPRGYIVQLGTALLPVASTGLSNVDPQVRRLAAEATQQLAAALDSQVPQPRTGEEAFDPLAERKELGLIHQEFMPLLEAIGKQKAVLARALQDDDVQVRLLTLGTLESLGSARLKLQRIVAPNAAAGSSPAPGAAGNPAPTGEPVARNENQQASPESPPDPLLQTLQAALPNLTANVANPNVQVRLAAIEALESFGLIAAPAADALVQALGDPDLFVRWAASRTLGKLPPVEPAAVAALARLLFDPDLEVRLAASTALDRFGPAAESALPALIRAVRASDADQRIAAIRTLGGIGTGAQSAVPALATALSDPDVRVRRNAAEILGRFGPLAVSAAPALRRALDDIDADVRKAASDALLSVWQGEK